MKLEIIIAFTVIMALSVLAKKGFGPGDQDYGYVTVRRQAHIFWWLFHTTAPVQHSTDRPLILLLEGGPGVSSTGEGNFNTIGPLDGDLKPRNTTWVKDVNVLFVDSPVGTGYSFVEDLAMLNENNDEIARDLVAVLKGFYNELPQFRTTPLYVYGESYGGKMAVDFVKLLTEEVAAGNLQSNISGLALGNGVIHPVYALLGWGPYLYQLGLVDKESEIALLNKAMDCKWAVDEGRYKDAKTAYDETLDLMLNATDSICSLNVVRKTVKKSKNEEYGNCYYEYDQKVSDLMNGPVKEALGIPRRVVWYKNSKLVAQKLEDDMMKPVAHIVERLLNETTIKVHFYNGNTDLTTCTPSQLRWINELRWPHSSEFANAPRNTIWVNDRMEGYVKTGGKFSFFWINMAGHMVLIDNPAAARATLKSMTGF